MSTNEVGSTSFAPAESDPVSRLTDSAVSLRAPAGETPVPDLAMVPMEARASIRVLVIDDDRILREGCASVLQVEGYNVASSGRGAPRRLHSLRAMCSAVRGFSEPFTISVMTSGPSQLRAARPKSDFSPVSWFPG